MRGQRRKRLGCAITRPWKVGRGLSHGAAIVELARCELEGDEAELEVGEGLAEAEERGL